MSIKVKCPNPACNKSMTVKDSWAGKKGKCPACGSVINVPDTSIGDYSVSLEEKQCPKCNRTITIMSTICPYCKSNILE